MSRWITTLSFCQYGTAKLNGCTNCRRLQVTGADSGGIPCRACGPWLGVTKHNQAPTPTAFIPFCSEELPRRLRIDDSCSCVRQCARARELLETLAEGRDTHCASTGKSFS
jgi:hypothetical protein